MNYWLIYVHTDRLEGPQAKLFEMPEADEIQSWIDEHDNIKVLDFVPQSEVEDDD